MIKFFLYLSIFFVSSSCGGLKFLDEKGQKAEREIASIAVSQLLDEEDKSFSAEIDETLLSLHSYYVIGQMNLIKFDDSLQDSRLEDLYKERPYLNLLALKTQVDAIENELAQIVTSAKNGHAGKHKILIERMMKFSKKSLIASLSMENLFEMMDVKVKVHSKDLTGQEIEKEYAQLSTLRDFQIFEKNVDHLSHMMEMDIKSSAKKFKPSLAENGNLSGQEFPAKVWVLTFDNGPDKVRSKLVLENLKARNLKATFFQIAQLANLHLSTSQAIRDAGMEIGSHSYSHKELTTVGGLTMEKEISLSTKSLEENLKIDVRFFRLPFGSGASTPVIREMIAKNNLIHAIWNIDTLDWMAQTPDKIIKRTKLLMKKTPRDGGVILFHDVHMRAVLASAEIMDHLKLDGRRACTLGKIVNDMNEGSKTVCSKN
jgi:peptidoglycan/xylan/chitin deacetylase (PgdA/CDA1 family)